MAEPSPEYLDPQTLARIKDLELTARRVIEGLISGSHKSPFQGTSVEFAEHREYVPGDDVRHIDWKAYGKTDKIYLKQFEQETNLVCNLVLDASESMSYGSAGISKHLYASRLAASLAYLAFQRQDSVGLALFEDALRYHVQPSSQAGRMKQYLKLLAVCQPANLRSRVGEVLEELAGKLRKRSLVILLSDCFDDVDRIVLGLRRLRYQRHEVVVFHVLDPAELEFPFEDVTMFRGLENYPELLTDPRSLRDAYQAEFHGFARELESGCRSADVDYRRMRTDQPLDVALATFLSERAQKRSRIGG